jgi:agmatinase
VTLGAVIAARQRFPDLSVLQIDAHSDLRLEYEGNRYSHASVMARVHELGVPLVQVGIRAQCREEAELIRSSDSIRTWYAHQVHAEELRRWCATVADQLSGHVYVTIDADGFDPSVVPAVGTAEPNGLTWSQVTEVLRAVSNHHRVVGFDVVEVAPTPPNTLSEYTMAKLIYKFMGMLVASDRNAPGTAP